MLFRSWAVPLQAAWRPSGRPGGRQARQRRRPNQHEAGLTLLELLLSLVLGLLFCMVLIEALVAQGGQGALLARLVRERSLQRRTLELVRGDLLRAEQADLASAVGAACAMAGRQPILQMKSAAGVITYSLGDPPSPIWRGRVLMRCGPAFGLDGEPSAGASQNRVVIDGLSATGFRAESSAVGQLRLSLEQELTLPGGRQQRIRTGSTVAAVVVPPVLH